MSSADSVGSPFIPLRSTPHRPDHGGVLCQQSPRQANQGSARQNDDCGGGM